MKEIHLLSLECLSTDKGTTGTLGLEAPASTIVYVSLYLDSRVVSRAQAYKLTC